MQEIIEKLAEVHNALSKKYDSSDKKHAKRHSEIRKILSIIYRGKGLLAPLNIITGAIFGTIVSIDLSTTLSKTSFPLREIKLDITWMDFLMKYKIDDYANGLSFIILVGTIFWLAYLWFILNQSVNSYYQNYIDSNLGLENYRRSILQNARKYVYSQAVLIAFYYFVQFFLQDFQMVIIAKLILLSFAYLCFSVNTLEEIDYILSG